jgi:ATP-dependent DNA helicase RecG
MTLFGVDPVADAVDSALRAVERGENPPERRLFDFKEEAGRRGAGGVLRSGSPHNEDAARKLAGEVACMANSMGGGALIVGIADDATPVGADLDGDWLQVRLYQLLQQAYTTVVTEAHVRGVRVLIVRCPPAVEPIRWQNRITWRVGDQCQDVDPSTWHERRSRSWGYDWSAQSSGLKPADARAQALQIARDFLQNSGDPRAEDLADASEEDLLRRLAAIKDDGTLTNAAALLFAGRRTAALDHIRRPGAGADSQERINEPGRSLLEELAEVFAAVRAYNPEAHVERGLVIGRVRALPERAVREAIVNGIAHREWTDENPTTVEHIGRTLRVTSPGGFYGGVRSDNIINHPPISRNKDLSQLLATLRIAERQGVGVDRMFADMIRHGHPSPVIEELDGVAVRTVLAGERPDLGWIEWIAGIDPEPRRDLRVLMTLHHLSAQRWTDPVDLAPVLQLTVEESRQAVERLLDHRRTGRSVCREIDGIPPSAPVPSIAMDVDSIEDLAALRRTSGAASRTPSREQIARSYARARGRISTTELGSIVGAARTNVGGVLRSLEQQGELVPSRASRRGPGFYYRFVPDPE